MLYLEDLTAEMDAQVEGIETFSSQRDGQLYLFKYKVLCFG
ncbi:hypothetical protein [Candidatus Enterococcus ferrettii]|uniref:Uncharacterized protein n=1 Tax=Candidatus Enterococcus ferrettii TaxID=2815324 RepID=A0ABV0EM45_9ENTE|nr:hypothetical protein [Enterococcus sp. 665A]